MKAKFLFIPAILLSAACQQAEIENPSTEEFKKEEVVYSISLMATKGEVGTKALDLVTGTQDRIDAYWKDTEKVKVFKDGTLLGTLDVTPATGEKPSSASLSGSITTEGLAASDELTLRVSGENWDYTGQVGTLADIETSYDYATATVTIDTVDDVNHTITTTGNASFGNQQSIYRFGFKVGGNFIDPKSFTVSASNGALVTGRAWNGSSWASSFGSISITPASAAADHFYYSSIRNESTDEDSYGFIVTGEDDALYLGTKTIPASVLDVPGKFISAKNITISKPALAPASGEIDDPINVF